MPIASKSLLIVDDTPTNLGIVSGVLKDLYRTKVATNGEKALVLAASEKPDLILLDGNPLQDIANTRRIAGVFAQGRYYSRKDLDGMIAQQIALVH